MNEVYESLLVTVGVSMLTKKVLKESLKTPETVKGALKLAVAVSAGTLITKYVQDKKYLPVDPFK